MRSEVDNSQMDNVRTLDKYGSVLPVIQLLAGCGIACVSVLQLSSAAVKSDHIDKLNYITSINF